MFKLILDVIVYNFEYKQPHFLLFFNLDIYIYNSARLVHIFKDFGRVYLRKALQTGAYQGGWFKVGHNIAKGRYKNVAPPPYTNALVRPALHAKKNHSNRRGKSPASARNFLSENHKKLFSRIIPSYLFFPSHFFNVLVTNSFMNFDYFFRIYVCNKTQNVKY